MSNKKIKSLVKASKVNSELANLRADVAALTSAVASLVKQVAPAQQQQVAPAGASEMDALLKVLEVKQSFTLELEKIRSGKEFLSDVRKAILT